MKKIILGALFLCLLLSACGKEEQTQLNSSVDTTKPTTESATKHTAGSTTVPSSKLTVAPTTEPNAASTTVPTTQQTTVPTTEPTSVSTTTPTTVPSTTPTTKPTTILTTKQTTISTTVPTSVATTVPTTTSAPTYTTEPTVRPNLGMTTKPTTSASVGPGSPAWIERRTYDEYLAYIQEHALPSYFVRLEQLPPMGEFSRVKWAISGAHLGTYEEYVYMYELPSGFLYSLEIDHKYENRDFTHEVINHQGNLQELEDKSDGVKLYKQSGVSYLYIQGELWYIEWEYNNIRFRIDGNRPGENGYWDIADAPSFIQDLLHTDTVEKAMQTFKESMEAAAVK